MEDTNLHNFFLFIRPKLNAMTRLELKLANFYIEILQVNHFATGNTPQLLLINDLEKSTKFNFV